MNAKRLWGIGWKTALTILIMSAVVYRLQFSPLPVESSVVKTGPIVSEVMGTGTLEARVRAIVSARISGRLSDVLADQGDSVKKGQLLATLDDGDLRQQVAIARAEVEATRAGIERSAADVNTAQATAVHARAFYNRVMPLVEKGVVSRDNFDNAQQQKDVAESQLSRARLAKVELEHQLVKAKAALKYAEEKLDDTRICAPFDALVIQRDRDPGAIVVPGSSILQIVSTEQMWVSAWVDESAMAALAVGQPARVVFRSQSDKSYPGTIARIAPLADRQTREFLVDVRIEQLPQTWAVGQRAEVYIQTARKDSVLLAPSNAVVWQKGKPGLFISNDGHAKWMNIEIGIRGKDSVEILSGLSTNDTVIWPRDAKTPIQPNRAVRTQ